MSSISEKILKPKLGLLELAKHLGNVSQACKTMGYSRDTFYRYKELYEQGGEEALHEISRKKPIEKNRVPAYIEDAVVFIATDNPALGQKRVSLELQQKGIIVSPGGVRSIWLRHGLETFKKRLKALEKKSAEEGILLTEEQLRCLEKAKLEKQAHGEIETEHPGYLCSQDTYFVGTMKGVGRIYQQTVIDTYTRVAFAKLYLEKTAITAADMLNSEVLPWFNERNISVLRILTDRGTEYCGNVENHSYQLYMALENIDHSKTKARSPQTNGICERFHRTMKEEFYDVAFRKKVYQNLDELQRDVNEWLRRYNEFRPHSGKYCYGRTPYQTFLDTKAIALEKQIGQNTGLVDEEKLLSNNFDETSRLAPLSGHENKSQISLGADNESINNLTKNVQLLMSE